MTPLEAYIIRIAENHSQVIGPVKATEAGHFSGDLLLFNRKPQPDEAALVALFKQALRGSTKPRWAVLSDVPPK